MSRMLMQAKDQHNLESRLEVDASGRRTNLLPNQKEEQDLANARGGR